MTKTHFEAIAASFKARMTNPTVPSDARVALIALANSQADLFQEWNPRFDRDKFLTACGM
jgi:hypothetical protein